MTDIKIDEWRFDILLPRISWPHGEIPIIEESFKEWAERIGATNGVRRTGYTTRMIEDSIRWYEAATVFPFCFVTQTEINAVRIMHKFIDKFHEFNPLCDRKKNMVILNNESMFLFCNKRQLTRYKMQGISFCEVVFDNECF